MTDELLFLGDDDLVSAIEALFAENSARDDFDASEQCTYYASTRGELSSVSVTVPAVGRDSKMVRCRLAQLLSELSSRFESDFRVYYFDRLLANRKNGGLTLVNEPDAKPHQKFWNDETLGLISASYTLIEKLSFLA